MKAQVVHALGRPVDEQWALFALNSPDGDQGWPGSLRIEARVVLRSKVRAFWWLSRALRVCQLGARAVSDST